MLRCRRRQRSDRKPCFPDVLFPPGTRGKPSSPSCRKTVPEETEGVRAGEIRTGSPVTNGPAGCLSGWRRTPCPHRPRRGPEYPCPWRIPRYFRTFLRPRAGVSAPVRSRQQAVLPGVWLKHPQAETLWSRFPQVTRSEISVRVEKASFRHARSAAERSIRA